MIAFELTGEGQSRISSSLDGAPSGELLIRLCPSPVNSKAIIF